MTKFLTAGAAYESLIANKFTYTQWSTAQKKALTATPTHDADVYLRDYARIAAFLCDDGQFAGALKRVSANLWDAYLTLPLDEKNKFTRAMSIVARKAGFDFQDRIKLDTSDDKVKELPGVAPIGIMLIGGDPQLGYMLRNKLFWKDSMDSRHGEHSHSLQWLAIAEGCSTVTPKAVLYSQTGNYRAPSQGDKPGERSFLMWQWLCDCFPEGMARATGGEMFMNGERLVSASFRSPQYIMDHLLLGNPKHKIHHFVSTYLYRRYKNRGWLAEVEMTNERTRSKSTVVNDIQTTDIKAHGKSKMESGAWKVSPSSPDARLIRDPVAYAKLEKESKTGYKVVFHGRGGLITLEG